MGDEWLRTQEVGGGPGDEGRQPLWEISDPYSTILLLLSCGWGAAVFLRSGKATLGHSVLSSPPSPGPTSLIPSWANPWSN